MPVNHLRSIMLLGTENPVALPVIRALGSVLTDIPLHAISRPNNHPVHLPRYSRYIQSHDYLESTDEDEIFQEITDKTGRDRTTILLPVDEYFVRLLSAQKKRYEEYACLPPLPDTKIFDSLVYKNKLGELLAEFDFPNAITYSLDKVNISQLDDDLFPCLLKPVRGSSGYGILKVADKKALMNSLDELNPEDYILQEYIPGTNIDCSLLAVNGDIKAFTIQKGLENVGFMFSTAIHFEHDQNVLNSVQKLMEITSYSGLAHLDFRLDERDHMPKLIDFNARFWHSLLGSRAAGVDFSLLCCLSAIGAPFDKPLFSKSTYMMGRSTFDHYRRKLLQIFPFSSRNNRNSLQEGSVFTDLRDRILDPLPEIMRMLD